MSKITKSWKTLTEAQMLGWGHLAEHTSGQSVFGQAAKIKLVDTPSTTAVDIKSDYEAKNEVQEDCRGALFR
ncbi:MAG: hypothetical protein ACI4TU_09535 [Candidatus Cryptobacteroides sp.]